MGVVIPQVIAEDRASGAQIIDGSLKFDRGVETYVTRIPTSTGNQNTWTWSTWVKRSSYIGSRQAIFGNVLANATTGFACEFDTNNRLDVFNINSSGTYNGRRTSSRRFRDIGWYHIVIVVDTSLAIADKIKVYVNGDRITDFDTNTGIAAAVTPDFNTTNPLSIGRSGSYNAIYSDNCQSQVYFIDGQALGPEYFGFTDPLTNTWRPKKYTGEFTRSSPNDGTWNATSSLSTTDSISSSTPAGNAFDGNLTTRVQTTNAAAGIALTFAPNNAGINFTTSLEVYCDQGTNVPTATWNGNTVNPGQNQWVTVYSGSGELSSTYPLTINTETAAQYATLVGVRVDGEILIDGLNNTGVNSFHLPMDGNSPIGEDKSGNGNDWDPKGFGSLELDNPNVSGALPILNTTNGGNTATVGVRTDAYASSLVLALPLVGNTNDVSNQINSGTTAKVITANDAISATTTSNFYNGSYYFDGTGDNIESADSSDFAFGTGDITIEMWVYFNSLVGTLWDSGAVNTNSNCAIFVDASYTYWYMKPGTDINVLHTTSGLNINRWNHLAFVRQGSTCKIYINGKAQVTETNASNVTAEKGRIGTLTGYTQYDTNGYIQDVRVYKGVAKYTSDFVVPSTSPDVLPETPSGVSGSSKLTKIADGAVYFDGVDDYLTIPWSSHFDLGTDSDFTIEFFVNFQDDATTSTILSWGADINNRFDIGCQSANTIRMYAVSGGNIIISGTAPIVPKRWHHIVVIGYSDVSSGTSAVVLYVDGERKFANIGALDTYAMPTDTSNGVDIGRRRYGTSVSDYFGGYISNLRIVKGSAIYPYSIDGVTQNYLTVPTSKLTAITNTKLLCCQSNTSAGPAAVVGLNDGRIWSDASQTNFLPGTFSNAFDNDASSYAETTGTDLELIGSITFDPAIPISSITTFKASSSSNGSNSQNWGFNGGSMTARVCNGVTDLSDLLPGSGNLTSFEVQKTGSGVAALNEIEINGIRLIDGGGSLTVNGDAAATNFTPFNTDINTVRGQETNYATLNPLATQINGSMTLSNGNLTATIGGTRTSAYANLPFVGKMYYEVTSVFDRMYVFGMAPSEDFNTTADTLGQRFIGESYGSYGASDDGNAWNNLVNTSIESFTVGDCMGWAYDSDSGKYSIFKNGFNIGTFTADTSRTYYPAITMISSGAIYELNFGQKPFKFPPPDGYQPLNAANVRPETVIARPDQYVGVSTWSGNNVDGRLIETSFEPDFVWQKRRDGSSNHNLYDTIRGAGKRLSSDSPGTEENQALPFLKTFEKNGFTVSNDGDINGSSGTHVAWCWKAGGRPDPDLRCTTRMTGNVYSGEGSYDNLFDGSLTTHAMPDRSLTWSPTNWTEANSVTSFRIHATRYANGGNGGTLQVVHSGGTVNITVDTATRSWHDVYSSGTNYITDIQSVTWTKEGSAGSNYSNNSYALVFAFEINGTVVTNTSCGAAPALPYYIDDVGYATTTAAGLTAGSNNPTSASVGTKQGFSIIKFTSPSSGNFSIAHGLSQTPDFVLSKSIDNGVAPWYVYHKSLPVDNYLRLNASATRASDGSNQWGDGMTSSVVGLQAGYTTVADTNQILYVWHDVPGLQKFGTYEGNGLADGPFVELGFRPAIVMVKYAAATGSANWFIYDSERGKFNPDNASIMLNDAAIEQNLYDIDFLSNGFKLRYADTSGFTNYSDTYIYCAWAEAPSINLYGATSNAR